MANSIATWWAEHHRIRASFPQQARFDKEAVERLVRGGAAIIRRYA
jgi:hypothetical protein